MAHVIVAGAGGNIGSHLVAHLGRCGAISSVGLIDHGVYEPSNVETQDIASRDVGRAKAAVQARRLRRINPALKVDAIQAGVEDLPLGAWRADVILACLDSRRARLIVNQAAWRLGAPWIDAGVSGADRLVRVQAFVPGADAACLECAWDQRDYDAVEQRYACHSASDVAAPPTNAPSSLGALAAALQAIECGKLLAGDSVGALVGRNLVIDAGRCRHFVTSFRSNPSCRMPDHDGWRIERIGARASRVTLRDLLQRGVRLQGSIDGLTLRVAGQRFALTVTCVGCGALHFLFRLERSLPTTKPTCQHCLRALQPSGFELFDDAPLSASLRPMLNAPVSRVGIRDGDVVSLVTPSAEAHYEIGGTS